MEMNATMSSFAGSGANSPALATANAHLPPSTSATSLTAPASPSGAYSASALAYANAQLSHFAATAGGTALPAHLNPHTLSSALSEYSMSLPNSATSSPGATPRRLPGTGASTPGGNSRIAASAVTGKRLNWSEMICQTIAESESGRLVIQDLFEGMCAKFPEIREWAFGKDWEARVKNRIKSTLSIKGNLFVKVPRPSSAAGKGSWWTLSQEAQDAWKAGRMANLTKTNGHSRAPSAGPSSIHGSPVRTVSSKFGGPTSNHTPNPPYMIQNSHAHHNHSQRTSPLGLGLNSTTSDQLANSLGYKFGDSLTFSATASPQVTATNPSLNLANSQSDVPNMAQPSQPQQTAVPPLSLSQPHPTSLSGTDFSNLTFFPSQPLGNAQSMPHLGGPQSMPFPASTNPSSAATVANSSSSNNGDDGNDGNTNNNNDTLNDTLNSFSQFTTADFNTANYSTLFEGLQGLGSNSMGDFGTDSTNNQLGIGLPFPFGQTIHHPFGGSIPGAYTLLQNQNQHDPFANPFGSNPNSFNATGQTLNSSVNSGNNVGGTSSVNDFNSSGNSPFQTNGLEGPSPADSAWFSYTPLVEPSTQIPGQPTTTTSALGQLSGEGNKKRRASEGLRDIGEFQLPPSEAGSG